MARTPLLADPADVLADLGYSIGPTKMPDIGNAAVSAMRLSTAWLAASLQTGFEQAQVVDTFFVESPTDRGRNAWSQSYEFRLSHGFVNAAPALAAIYAETAEGLVTSNANANTSAALTVDLEKGRAVDLLNRYSRRWVQITYTKGFPVNGASVLQGTPALFDQNFVPPWLNELAVLLCKIQLASNPSLEDPQIKMDTRLGQGQANNMLKPHMRYTPSAILPKMTTMFGPQQQATATMPTWLPTGDIEWPFYGEFGGW